ncbi:MAG: Asp-tRNA(Asn)/Glu-tRNA(Gln) amidotransferase subunit GatA [Phycisphaerales bacterium]
MSQHLLDLSAVALAAAVRSDKASAVDAAKAALARAATLNPLLNIFTETFHDEALKQAAAIDALVAAGRDPGPLAGVPVAIKDNICLSWGRTTCGSRILENYHSPFTATAAQKIIDAGAVIIGKTNCDEFAMGSSTEHSFRGPTRNPWDPDRIPGGSSGGSAAAVAARIVPIALGSDTGGSIRQPASHCGVVGIKPTYGRVSRWGLVAYASSLDQIGPFARTCEDAALVLDVICGHDPHDSTSAQLDHPRFHERVCEKLTDLTIGVPRQAHSPANSHGVSEALGGTIELLRSSGAKVIDVDLPHIDHGIAAYYIIAPAEASSNLARFDGVRYGRRARPKPDEGLMDLYCRSRSEGFGAEVQRRIMLGTHVLSSGYYDAYYTTALKTRRLIKQDYDRAFAAGCQAILMPAAPGPAFRIGEKTDDPLAMYLEDVYTVGINLAGLPGLTIPAGFQHEPQSGRDLPVGVQLIGPALGEDTILRIGAMLQDLTDFHARTCECG